MEEEEAQATKMVERPHLPHDLIVDHILTRLPIISLLKFKCVSKLWYSTLSSSQFANTHLKFLPLYHPTPQDQFLFIQNKQSYHLLSYYDDDFDVGDEMGSSVDARNMKLMKLRVDFNDDELVLIGSCNGLVCLGSNCGDFFILWNPITGKFRKYDDPDLVVVDSSSNVRVSWGFGYVSSIDDYKVVRIIELNDLLVIRVHVFSVKSNKWIRIANGLYGDIFSMSNSEHEGVLYNEGEAQARFLYAFQSRHGVLVNETLYWIVSRTMNNWDRKILAFDFALEAFNAFVDLNLDSNSVCWDKFLCVMGGCLSKCGVNKFDDVFIAILKGPGEVKNLCLSREWRLRSCQGFVGFTGRDKFFILLEDSTIGIVDPTSQPMKYTPLVTLESAGKSRVSSYVSSYVPSLISPYTAA